MGATFAALHVRTPNATRVLEVVRRFFRDAEFEELAGDETAPRERRVLVYASGAWVVVADEDMESGAADDGLAAELTRALDTAAVAISVFHSDVARLVLHVRGRRAGAFEVPDDASARRDGHAHVAATFLAPLALDDIGRAELARGLLADHTFPEETTHRAAALVGIEHPGAGVRYQWRDPPAGATKLRFRAPAEPDAEQRDAWRPAGLEHDVQLGGPEALRCAVGTPLEAMTTFDAQAFGGARIDGLGVELTGAGLALLEIEAIAGWNPIIDDGGARQTTILVATPARTPGRLFAAFPEGFVAPTEQPTLAGTTAADLRAYSESLAAQSYRRFVFHLRGRARAAGDGEIAARLVRADGAPIDAPVARLAVSVRAAPRAVIVPEPPAGDDHPAIERRLVEAAAAWNGADYLAMWIGFDGAWADHEAWLVALAEEIGERLPTRELSIATNGTHPKAKTLAAALPHLRREADVRVHRPSSELASHAERDLSEVRLRHQPNGSTVLPRELRDALAARHASPRIVPIDLWFALTAGDDLAQRAEAVLEAAAARPGCVGGFIAPLGQVPEDAVTPYELLARTSRIADVVDARKRHARCPGWRFLVPAAAAGRVQANDRVRVVETAAGLLVKSTAPSPSAMTAEDRDAVERCAVRCIATPDEARAFAR